jgi:cytochrome c-type biogenesis protein CcmE
MNMRLKLVIGAIVIVVFVIFGAYSFLQSNVEYTDFNHAKMTSKKVQVKGAWLQDQKTEYLASTNQFVFYMVDDNNTPMKVVLDGAKPNNFELATSIVVKGRCQDGYFHATDILTKCPSKYQATGNEVKRSS